MVCAYWPQGMRGVCAWPGCTVDFPCSKLCPSMAGPATLSSSNTGGGGGGAEGSKTQQSIPLPQTSCTSVHQLCSFGLLQLSKLLSESSVGFVGSDPPRRHPFCVLSRNLHCMERTARFALTLTGLKVACGSNEVGEIQWVADALRVDAACWQGIETRG